MIKLDWQTVEEEDWPPEPPEDPRPDPPSRWAMRRWLLVALCLTVAALITGGRQIALQVARADAQTRAAVLAAHQLVLQAAEEGDTELFATLLTGRDSWWIDAQVDMVANGRFLNRQSLGLIQHGPAGAATVTELSPDLNLATVTFPVQYIVDRPAGPAETVTLQQAMTYVRTAAGQWRYTRPDIDTWGEWQRTAVDNLHISYRSVEGALGARLADDLLRDIQNMCQYTGLCPDRTDLAIRLEETLNGLPQLSRAISILPHQTRISMGMPTPLLVGVPQDEAAYQALRAGYARHVLGFLIPYWELPDGFLNTPTYSTALLHRRFTDLDLSAWPAENPPAGDPPAGPPPYPWPNQQLATICVGAPQQGSELWLYDFAADRWSPALAGGPFDSLTPLPDDSGLIIHELTASPTGDQRLLLWRPGDPLLTFAGGRYLATDRAGRGGTVNLVDRGYGWQTFRLPDFIDCTPAGCALERHTYHVANWSPDGRYLAYLSEPGDRYYLRDLADGSERILTAALAAYWADADTLALVRSERPSRQARRIMLVDVPDGALRELAFYQELREQMPGGDEPSHSLIEVHDVLAWPGREDAYLVLVSPYEPYDPRSSYFPPVQVMSILAVYPAPESGGEARVEHITTMEGQVFAPLQLSPTGRWLSLPSFQPETSTTHLFFFDLEKEEAQLYTFTHDLAYVNVGHDWTADDRWLALADRGLLQIIAPDTGYARELVPPTAGCTYAAWLNP